MNVICSKTECVELLYKAALGAGFPVASAKHAATAAIWMQSSPPLATAGIEGFALMLDAINYGPGDPSTRVRMGADDQVCTVEGGSLIDVGPCALDALAANPNCGSVVISGAAGGALIVGMALGPAAPPSLRSRLSVSVEAEAQVAARIVAGEDQAVVCLDSFSWSAEELAVANGEVDVSDDLWERARDLAAVTYVPSSAESRQGAGAGLTDND